MLGPTEASDLNWIMTTAESLGMHYVGLSYTNSLAGVAACKNLARAGDDDCYLRYHRNRVFGDQVDPFDDGDSSDGLLDGVQIGPADSIQHRLRALLVHLASLPHSAGEGWGQFLGTGNAIRYPKIVLGGGSQGAGHAIL